MYGIFKQTRSPLNLYLIQTKNINSPYSHCTGTKSSIQFLISNSSICLDTNTRLADNLIITPCLLSPVFSVLARSPKATLHS